MTEKKKQSIGQLFLATLEHAKDNKNQLLKMACAVIRAMPQEGKMADKKLPDTVGGVLLPAAVAKINIEKGLFVSSDAMIMILMKEYHDHGFGSPEKFKSDFKKAFPEEYGKDKASEAKLSTAILMRAGAHRQAQI